MTSTDREDWRLLCPVCRGEACDNPSHIPPELDDDTADLPPVRHAPAPAPVPAPGFLSAGDVMTQPAPVEIVEGIAQAGRITVLVSESGAGKTFVLLNLAAAISSDVAWHGRDVVQGSVAYLSYEGDALGLRMRAIREHQGHRLEHLYILDASEPLSPRLTHDGEVRSVGEATALAALTTLATELAAAGRPPIRLLVVDTVRASLTGSEDSSEPVAAYMRVVRRLLDALPDAAGILAHHAGWQDGESQKKRERGSSAWRGNCDLTLYLETEAADKTGQAQLTVRQLKVRDGERLPPLELIRRRVEISGERTRRGQPVTSCVIEMDRRTREDKAVEAAAVVTEQQLAQELQVLRAIADHPDEVTSYDRIRLLAGLGKNTVNETLPRLLRKRWMRLPEKERQPYTVTTAGQEALTDELVMSRTQ